MSSVEVGCMHRDSAVKVVRDRSRDSQLMDKTYQLEDNLMNNKRTWWQLGDMMNIIRRINDQWENIMQVIIFKQDEVF